MDGGVAGRPGTRSGIGGMGAPVQATMRPGTMLPGGGMPPPGTAATRAPTASRMGTMSRARQGTAAQQPVLGVGAMTEVQVSDRPMTMHGLSGMKTGGMGPKRQIYDKSYYLVELRKRCQDLSDEIASLNKEISDVQQDNQTHSSLERRFDLLAKSVRNLEGDLADHNLATDKQRTDTPPEEVQHLCMLMKSQNEQVRADVDQIFLEKRGHEEEIMSIDKEMADIARAAEERLNELHPTQRQEYEELRDESNTLASSLAEARDELDQVSGRLDVVEGRLRSDVLRTRQQHLGQARRELLERLEELQMEVRQCSMPIPAQRELLLSKVKSDNAEIVATEKRIGELKLENERLRSHIREVTTDTTELKNGRTEDNDQQKYDILFTKDKEMTQFIDGFSDSRAEEERKLKQKQEAVQQLLEDISKALGLPPDVTPESHLREMEDELDFKNRALQNSENTQNRLQGELAKREGELEKIESLDVKISMELEQVQAKIEQYESEVATKYDRLEEMRRVGEDRIRDLEGQKVVLEHRSGALKQQVNFLKINYDAKLQQLQDDQTVSALEAQEQKIRHFFQNLYLQRSFIMSKTSETNYDGEMVSVLDMADRINKILQEQGMRPVGN